MKIRFYSQRYLPLFFIFLSVSCALAIFAIEKIGLFGVVSALPIDDFWAQKPVSTSARVYQTGKCKFNLYGWTYSNPGPTDGADEYIKVRRVKATLDSLPVDAKADLTELRKNIWTVDVPTQGILKITFEDYVAPRNDLKDVTFHLDCERPWTAPTWLSLIAVSTLSGIVGLILTVILTLKFLYLKIRS